jgi:outer membrane receptor for ferrienterochelin and colicins
LKYFISFILLSSSLIYSNQLLSQESIKVKGVVLNSSGEGIPYVTIFNLTESKGTITEDDGTFVFKSKSSNIILKISSVGFETIIDTVDIESDSKLLTYQMISDVFGLGKVVVTGTRNEENIRESVVGVKVTDSRTLELVNAVSISDGLNYQPGLRTETNCQNCGYSQVRINGLPGKYSQILINGRQTFSSLNSVYGLEQIPAVLVDRIEVVKGGGSALYGANAMGGVINILTKDPINSGIEIGVNSGIIGFESWEVNSNILGAFVSKNNKLGLNFIGGYRFRESYDANKDGFTELPELNGYSGELKLYYKPLILHRLNFSVRGNYEFRRGGDQLDLAPEQTNITEQLKSSILGGELSYEFYSKDKKNKFDFYGSSQYTHMDNYYGAGFDQNGYGLTTDLTSLAGILYSHFFNSILKDGSAKLTFGSEYRNNEIRDDKPGYNVKVHQNIHNLGVFGQYDWKILKWFKINVGLRMDIDNVINKPVLNPRLGFLFDTKVGIQVRGNYSRGYMSPQLFSDEIHAEIVSGEFRRVVLGDDLIHETSNTITLGINYVKKKGNHEFYVGIEGFYTEINNPFYIENQLIDSNLVLVKQNGEKSYVAGINLDMKYAFKEYFMLESAFTIQDSRYTQNIEWTSGQYVSSFLKTPNYYGSFIISSKPLKNFTISTSLNITGDMLVPHYAGYIPTDRLEISPWFFDWGIKFSYDLDIGKYCLIFDLGMRNILNSYQSDFDIGKDRDGGYVYGPQRPRTLFFGIRFSTF